VAVGAACFAVAGGTAAGVCGFAGHLGETAVVEAPDVVGPSSVSDAVHKTWLGLGAGSDSTAARYAFPNVELQTAVGNVKESWYIKTYLELGVFGLAIVLALLGTIVVRAVRVHTRLRDPRLKVVSAAIVALMGWVLLYSLKAQYFDLDPINIYFWLFAGILMGLPRLERREAGEPSEREDERVPAQV
jgi:O-antigen ligase